MTRRTVLGTLLSGVLLVALVGCGGAATPIPASGGASAAASVAPPSSAASSVAQPSDAAVASVGALPSFELPSDDKGLEALLPDTICGTKSTKLSMGGERFTQSGQNDLLDAVRALGKTPADVSFAIAAGADSGCTAGILRVKGVDPNTFQTAMLAAQASSGETATQKNVGGKDVYVTADSDSSTYAYFHGDAVIFVSAKNDADAASVLKDLP